MAPAAPDETDDAAKRRRDAASLLLCLAAIAAFAAVCHVFGIVVCPLKRLTGVPCPTCGTTRACLAMLRGDVRAAFALQPFAVALVSGVAPALLLWAAAAGRARVRAFLAAAFARRSVQWLLAALLAADWIYVIRNGN